MGPLVYRRPGAVSISCFLSLITTSRKGWMRHLTGLERNLDMMLLEEENNRIQHVLALAICNRGMDSLARIFSLKTPLFLRRIKCPDVKNCISHRRMNIRLEQKMFTMQMAYVGFSLDSQWAFCYYNKVTVLFERVLSGLP